MSLGAVFLNKCSAVLQQIYRKKQCRSAISKKLFVQNTSVRGTGGQLLIFFQGIKNCLFALTFSFRVDSLKQARSFSLLVCLSMNDL